VYRQDGQAPPPGSVATRSGFGGPPGPGPPAWRHVCHQGVCRSQSTPVDCVVDDSGYEGPRTR